MFEFFALFAGAIFVGSKLLSEHEANQNERGYIEERNATHNFNRARQDYLTALFRKDDKECIKLLGESWKKYEVPSPAPKWGSKYWDEQVQIAVRKVARREGWSYYDFNTEYASSAYYGSSRKMRAENQMAYINHCLARQERFRKEIELNGE